MAMAWGVGGGRRGWRGDGTHLGGRGGRGREGRCRSSVGICGRTTGGGVGVAMGRVFGGAGRRMVRWVAW